MQLSTAQEATKKTGNIAVITQNIRIYITYVFCSLVINTYFSYTFHWTKNITNHNSLTYTLVVFTNGIFVQWPWICAHRKSTCQRDQKEHTNITNTTQKSSCNAENQLWDVLTSTHISHQMITIVTGVTDLGVRAIAAVFHCAVYCKTTMPG